MAVEPSGVHERFHSWTLMMGGEMNVVTRMIFLAMVGMILVVTASDAADVDRSAVDFKTPGDIKWVRNAAGTNESAVLFGDPSKPGPYVVRLRWLPGGKVHYDGAKDEEAIIQVWGMGPATSTPAEKR